MVKFIYNLNTKEHSAEFNKLGEEYHITLDDGSTHTLVRQILPGNKIKWLEKGQGELLKLTLSDLNQAISAGIETRLKTFRLKDVPIRIATEFASLAEKCRKLAFKHSDIVKFSDSLDDGLILTFQDADPLSIFFYHIMDPFIDKTTNVRFNVECLPSDGNLNRYQAQIDSNTTAAGVEQWISRIIEYNSAAETMRRSSYEKIYEEEFYKEYTEGEPLADEPFEPAQQERLYYTLEYIEEKIRLEPPSTINTEILEITDDIKKNLTTAPQSKIARSFSKIKAKMKMKGMQYFLGFAKGVKEELPKYLIRQGFDHLSDIGTTLQRLLHHH